MPNGQIPAAEVQDLLDRVAGARRAIGAAGDAERAAYAALEPGLRGIEQELGVAAGGKVDPAAWNALAVPLQTSLRERLESAAKLLDAVAGGPSDGPPDPKNIMHKAPASNDWIIFLTVVGILLTVAVLVSVWAAWYHATNLAANNGKGPNEAVVLRMIILIGALGGCLHWTTSLAMFVGNGQLLRRWIPYYLIMPFEGAALAPVIYLLLRTGVLAAPPSGGGAGTVQLNLINLYAFAGLTGLFAKQAIEMLADVFNVIFKKIQAKDAVQDKPKVDAGKSSTAASGGERSP